ncbi:MAG: acetyl-CoA hydrolase/transferase C-terminal domain-containing protein [Oceanicaulis sp.]
MSDSAPSDLAARADAIVRDTIARIGKTVVLGLPLALGKANHLANAFYRAAKADPEIDLTIYTALTLSPPAAPNALAARLLDPIAERLYAGYPRLDYTADRARNALPGNVTIKEFFLSPGGLLKNPHAQANYVSANYTHAARDIFDSGLNVIAQMVAPDPEARGRLSLSCNPDLTLDLIPMMKARAEAGTPTALLAEINPELPFFGHEAAVPAETFDAVLETPGYTLFPVPSEQVSDQDWAIAFRAAALIPDGGTLQIGIGALGDGLARAICLRDGKNAEFRAVLDRLSGPQVDPAIGGTGPFETGLYGCSEMITEGLIELLEAGVLRRGVHDDLDAQLALMQSGEANAAHPLIRLHGGFFLGSIRLYDRLRKLSPELREAVSMTAISRINQLYGSEPLDRAQRRDARFFNTAMMVNGRGAAISDTLGDGRVVSGIGGQYNFVAMARELDGARSVILVRAVRSSGGKPASNIRWQAGEVSVPRHLRDLVVTEYGVADLRGATDREVAVRLARVCDSRFQSEFLDAAKAAGKVEQSFELEPGFTGNTPEAIREALAEARSSGLAPDYPLGSDLDETEQALKDALGLLKERTSTKVGRAKTIAAALTSGDPSEHPAAMERMGLGAPSRFKDRLEARLVAWALDQTAQARA